MTSNPADSRSNGHLDLAIPPHAQRRDSTDPEQLDPLASLSGTLLDIHDQYTPAGPATNEPRARTSSHESSNMPDQAFIDEAEAVLRKARNYIRAEPRTAVTLAAFAGAGIAAVLCMLSSSTPER